MNELMKSLKLVFTGLLLSISYNTQAASSYTMPVGIPDTTIDFMQDAPARPADWSVEVPGYYYIDNVNGSTKVDYGSETTPRKYFPTTIPAGSYFEVSGDYTIGPNSGSYYKFRCTGTDEEWVANTSGPVWITQSKITGGTIISGMFILAGDNIFVDDMVFERAGKLMISSPTPGSETLNAVVRNSDINGSALTGIGLIVANAVNSVVYNNKIHGFGQTDATTDQDSHAVSIGDSVVNFWLLNNEIYDASGSGLQTYGSSTTTYNIYAGYNDVHDVRQAGLWVKGGRYVVYSTNHIHDIISVPWSTAKGIGAQYGPDDYWIINNNIEDVQYGIRIASSTTTDAVTGRVFMIGNVIHDIYQSEQEDMVGGTNSWQASAIHIVGGNEHYVYNNLIYNAPNGIDISTNFAPVDIRNNVIFDLTNSQPVGEYGRSIWSQFTSIEDGELTISNNYFDDHMRVQQGYTSIYTIADLEDQGSTGNISTEPFLSNTDFDTILANGSTTGFDLSAIIDKGSDISATINTLYTESFGISLTGDILKYVRTQGASIDIGAFEQDGAKLPAIISVIPAKPGNIQVIQKSE